MIPRQAVIEGTLLAFFLALNEPAAAQSGGFVYAVYVVNCGERCRFGGAGPGDISAYLMDETTGALREVDGSPILAGFNPAAIAANPSGTNVYVVNEFSEDTGDLPGTLSTYSTISSGRLKEQGPPITVGERPVSVAVDPSGQYVYVANSYGGISGFVLDTTGYRSPCFARRSPREELLAQSPCTPTADSSMWRTAVTRQFRGTALTRTPGSSRPCPAHLSL